MLYIKIILILFLPFILEGQHVVCLGIEFPKQYYQIIGSPNTIIQNHMAHRIYSVRYRYLYDQQFSFNTGFSYRTLNVAVGLNNGALQHAPSIGGGIQIPFQLGFHKRINSSRFTINPILGSSIDFNLFKGFMSIVKSTETNNRSSDTITIITSSIIDRTVGVSLTAVLCVEYAITHNLYFSIFSTFSKGLVPVMTTNVQYKKNQVSEYAVQKYKGTYISYFGFRVLYALPKKRKEVDVRNSKPVE